MERPYVVGIGGGTASGKSTFCDLLEEKLAGFRVKPYHMDDYFKPGKERPHPKALVTGKVYMDDNHPLTVDVDKLQRDLTADIGSNSLDVIILEGMLTLFYDEIYELLDLKLYIDCLSDERIARRLRRNMTRGQEFDRIAELYLDMVRYRHEAYIEPSKWRADLIINGSSHPERGLEIVAAAVRDAVENARL